MVLIAAEILYGIVTLLHGYFVVLEMALWKKKGPRVFGISQQFADETAAMASNQGLYNGFLVAALLIGFFAQDALVGEAFMVYALVCVIAAGIWGAITVNRKIFFIQAVPALLSLALFFLNSYLYGTE